MSKALSLPPAAEKFASNGRNPSSIAHDQTRACMPRANAGDRMDNMCALHIDMPHITAAILNKNRTKAAIGANVANWCDDDIGEVTDS